MRLSEHIYKGVSSAAGPLIFIENVRSARIGELVSVIFPDGRRAEGEVLHIEGGTVQVQVFADTQGMDAANTSVVFADAVKRAPLAPEVVGRIFNGAFEPIDGMPMYTPDRMSPISGYAMNPAARERPREFIETGYSAIDGLNTLVKGQKLPVFSSAGLPAKELVAGILRNARSTGVAKENPTSGATGGAGGDSVVVFAALGLTFFEYEFYMRTLSNMADARFVAFVNLADEPVMQRLMAPRLALTVAEYLGFDLGMDVLVVITDITNYCYALREISTAREELPGRRGYPGYMYSDLASIYERAGRIKGRPGSVTMLPVLTMPEDDITHPIADLTGYITEGQIVLSRDLHQKGIFPPIDVLPSLSRLMHNGIGEGSTRADHRKVADRLYKAYARGRELRRLEAIVGRDGMGEADKRMLDFAGAFEQEFVGQGAERRGIAETLDMGIALLERFETGGKPA